MALPLLYIVMGLSKGFGVGGVGGRGPVTWNSNHPCAWAMKLLEGEKG